MILSLRVFCTLVIGLLFAGIVWSAHDFFLVGAPVINFRYFIAMLAHALGAWVALKLLYEVWRKDEER